MGDEELMRHVNRARRMLANLCRTVTEEVHDRDGPPGALALLLSAEMLASMVRRPQRDFGVPKHSVESARALASEVAGADYEGSGMGRSARLEHARLEAEKAARRPDSAFTAEQRDAAAREAADAIARIMRGEGN